MGGLFSKSDKKRKIQKDKNVETSKTVPERPQHLYFNDIIRNETRRSLQYYEDLMLIQTLERRQRPHYDDKISKESLGRPQQKDIDNKILKKTLEVPQHRIEIPQHRIEIPQHKIEIPQHRIEIPQHRIEIPQHRIEIPQQRVEIPQHRIEIPRHRGHDEVEMLSRIEKIPRNLALNFITLLLQGCTLPFIARYRKNDVDYLMPNRLQELYVSYIKITQFKKKVNTVVETLRKSQKLTPAIECSIYNSQNLAELDLVYAPLKSQSLSAADIARNLGLERHALSALNGEYVDLRTLSTGKDELSTVAKVQEHITHLIADIIYKDTRVVQKLRQLKDETNFTIQSRQTASSIKEKDENEIKSSRSDPETYHLYLDWQGSSDVIKPHQTLALNRGVNENILSVKVIVPDSFYNKLEKYCLTLWKSKQWVSRGLADGYNGIIKSWLSKKVRSDLTTIAQKEAVKTFTTNLEKYLLTDPIKNRTIAGLDPGFKAGCKVGIINCNGAKLTACAIYPNLRQLNNNDRAATQFINLLVKYRVELIGLGNGTGCRETEAWLKYHGISASIPVIIVPEQGASVYSISKEAQQEHPNMDPNLISALSIARRVLDPLGELIKVEPKNLGVGLYQHDIPAEMLESALECTVEKVVSLVGVDVNTASHAMLRRISGLNAEIAGNIIHYCNKNKRINSRAELYNIAGIDQRTFQQCAGFLRVIGGHEPLDATIIHPESYSIAKSFAMKIGVNIKELTQPHFSSLVESKVARVDISRMSKDLHTDVSTLELIINGFKQMTNEDNVITFCRPVYSMAVQDVDQVQVGTALTGVVRNVVPFGCFVDCGLGDDGLIHTSNMGANSMPKLGDRVAVTVIPSIKPKKIQFRLDRIID